ncbi:MAG TPA: amylo-alpha-1,6-glucosidase [Rhizomicrobium sp.]|nr:amylo-alpha-1,6-glucosidase [Rhizomicrobium sp.]
MAQGTAAVLGGEAETAMAIPSGPGGFFALKHGDTFLVADRYGDVFGEGDGLFNNDTRLLSRWRILLSDARPSLLSGAVSQDNVLFTANLTNHPLPLLGGASVPEGVIHIERTRFLWDTRLYERVSLKNFSECDATLPLSFEFGADFHDMFEVRGAPRPARGHLLPPRLQGACVYLGYEGLDGVRRCTALRFCPAPQKLTGQRADFTIALPAQGKYEIFIEIGLDAEAEPNLTRFRAAAARARFAMRSARRHGAVLRTSGRLFNDWMERSRADLALLTTELPTGPYPYAGIPWFSTPFGRDAIITSLQMLWLDPQLARGVLRFLADNQARERSSFEAAEPGKILHETRKGEMTALGELPFGRYYGGVDTTPLFVMLAGAYAERTADMDFIGTLWPSLIAAMAWVDGDGDSDGDGFLDYRASKSGGLVNQAWKDSNDSIFHADGSLAEGAIAVVEVQGYVYAARRAMAELAHRRGDVAAAANWRKQAESLRQNVEASYWMDDSNFYAIARDQTGQCRVRASNPGHLLYCGLPSRARAEKVIEQLLSPAFNSGWGLRTLAAGEPRFNPMSYHNGSVWPHDTALCTAGMALYGNRAGAIRVMASTFEAAVRFEMRMPELFCGFSRDRGEPPVAYPVACLPQAWSSGAVFMLLQACLGLRVDGFRREIHVDQPQLPIGIDNLVVRGITIGEHSIDLEFQRMGGRIVATPSGRGRGGIPVLLHV